LRSAPARNACRWSMTSNAASFAAHGHRSRRGPRFPTRRVRSMPANTVLVHRVARSVLLGHISIPTLQPPLLFRRGPQPFLGPFGVPLLVQITMRALGATVFYLLTAQLPLSRSARRETPDLPSTSPQRAQPPHASRRLERQPEVLPDTYLVLKRSDVVRRLAATPQAGHGSPSLVNQFGRVMLRRPVRRQSSFENMRPCPAIFLATHLCSCLHLPSRGSS